MTWQRFGRRKFDWPPTRTPSKCFLSPRVGGIAHRTSPGSVIHHLFACFLPRQWETRQITRDRVLDHQRSCLLAWVQTWRFCHRETRRTLPIPTAPRTFSFSFCIGSFISQVKWWRNKLFCCTPLEKSSRGFVKAAEKSRE